jgi:hypothetical protein
LPDLGALDGFFEEVPGPPGMAELVTELTA